MPTQFQAHSPDPQPEIVERILTEFLARLPGAGIPAETVVRLSKTLLEGKESEKAIRGALFERDEE